MRDARGVLEVDQRVRSLTDQVANRGAVRQRRRMQVSVLGRFGNADCRFGVSEGGFQRSLGRVCERVDAVPLRRPFRIGERLRALAYVTGVSVLAERAQRKCPVGAGYGEIPVVAVGGERVLRPGELAFRRFRVAIQQSDVAARKSGDPKPIGGAKLDDGIAAADRQLSAFGDPTPHGPRPSH
jgi:hypothetical protein